LNILKTMDSIDFSSVGLACHLDGITDLVGYVFFRDTGHASRWISGCGARFSSSSTWETQRAKNWNLSPIENIDMNE
jgi:hypothetical protein